jgi:SAM-dependent methyltransferase
VLLTVDLERLRVRSGEKVLDAGCGEGRHCFGALERGAHVVGLDLDLASLRASAGNLRQRAAECGRLGALIHGNAFRLPFSDGAFDKVICSEVLEHIPDYRSVLKEIKRVLKPGGTFAASVPRFFPEWICWKLSTAYHNEKGGHIRIFKADEIRNAIEDEGLSCFGQHGAHALHVPYWWLQCLFWSKRERSKIVKLYHKLLVWDLLNKPWITQTIDKLLNPMMGKSIVMYFK